MKFGKLTQLERVKREAGRKVYRFECECGEVVERRLDLVRSVVARGGAPECNLCLIRSGFRAPSSRHCLKCEGLPHRRPLVGKCRCGERYAPEELPPIWTIADSRRFA